MVLNIGYMELGGGGVVVRIYYDTTVTPAGPNQPLINGPRGWCLDVSNTSGGPARVTVAGLSANPLTVNIGAGDPVTNGPGRSRTAAEMASFGFTTRGNVGTVTMG